jgi:gas vesicle protein
MVKNGKIPKSKSIDSGRETRVLLENMSRDITRIAEAHSSTAAQIAEIKVTMATKSGLDIVSKAVMQLNSDLKEVKNDVKDLKNKVDENLSNHDKRITKLEAKVLV